MSKYSISALVLLLLLLPLAAPAAAQNKEHIQMEAELRMVQEQNQQLSLAFQQAMDAIKALNGRIDAAMEAMRKGFADQSLATKNMAGDVGTIAERSRESDSRLRALSDEIKTLQTTVTALGNALAQGGSAAQTGALDPGAAPGVVAPGPGPIAIPSTLGLNAGRMLEQAKGDYFRADHELAITGFQALIKEFPTTEAAAEAQYWIGESYFSLKKMREAVTAYNVVLEKTPRATYAAAAAFRRGEAQRSLGDLAAARASWELVVRQYPNTDSAGLAQQRLNGLPAQNTPARP
jgi:tol-pal system protein YbgF